MLKKYVGSLMFLVYFLSLFFSSFSVVATRKTQIQ